MLLLVSYSACQELAKAPASLPIPSSTHLPVQVVVSIPTSSQIQKNPSTNTYAKTFKHKYKYFQVQIQIQKQCQACQPPQPGWLLATLSLFSRPCPPDFPPTWVPLCRWQIQIKIPIWFQSIIISKIKNTKNEIIIQNVAAPGSLLPAASSSYLGSTAGQSAKIGRGEDDQGGSRWQYSW